MPDVRLLMASLRFSFGWFKIADVDTCLTIMPPAKHRRVIVTASTQGIDHAEKALLRLGFDSKSSFAKAQLMGKSTVDKFFNEQPIQLSSFKRICEGLKIEDWKSVAKLEPVVDQCGLADSGDMAALDVVEAIVSQSANANLTVARQITIVDRENGKVRFEIVLKGDIDSIDEQVQKTLETIFRSLSGQTITITDIQAGSIRIKIQGSAKDAAKLIDRLTSGELTEINGFPVEGIQILSQDFLEETEENNSDNKWDLVREITLHPVSRRQLSSADLSDADLSDADLSGADLSGADLSGADLSRANLISADLSRVNLISADLSGANLSRAFLTGSVIDENTRLDNKWRLVWRIVNEGTEGADLIDIDLNGANLIDADLSGADLNGARLSGARLIAANLNGANLNHACLSGANLRGAYLNGANLSDADLRGANLRGAYLNGANLSDADLRDANLSGAYLSGANLNCANVTDALLGDGIGLDNAEKRNLARRGAIFDDAPGDRSFTSSPSPTHR